MMAEAAPAAKSDNEHHATAICGRMQLVQEVALDLE